MNRRTFRCKMRQVQKARHVFFIILYMFLIKFANIWEPKYCPVSRQITQQAYWTHYSGISIPGTAHAKWAGEQKL